MSYTKRAVDRRTSIVQCRLTANEKQAFIIACGWCKKPPSEVLRDFVLKFNAKNLPKDVA